LFSQTGIDTIHVDLGKNRALVLISDDLNIFSKLSIDSLIRVIRKQYGGEFSNPSDTTAQKTFIVSTNEDIVAKPPLFPISVTTIAVGIGAGLVRNELSSFVSVGLGLSAPSDKRALQGFMITASPYFFFTKEDGQTKTLLNTFVDATFMFRPEALKRTFGVGAGYLVQRNGDYYDRNTSRLFVTYDPSGRGSAAFTVMPELTITGLFKKAYPGVSVRFMF